MGSMLGYCRLQPSMQRRIWANNINGLDYNNIFGRLQRLDNAKEPDEM